ncbi:MAG: thiolase family protein [Bacillota bacterium]
MKKDKKIAVVAACRTPIGRIPGELNYISDVKLLAEAFKEAVKRSGVPDAYIDSAYTGCSFPVERDNLCRKAVVEAGLSKKINGTTISKTCASSDEALAHATHKIQSGQAEAMLVGGIEKISNSSYALHFLKNNVRNIVKGNLPKLEDIENNIQENDMVPICEMLSRKYNISRHEQDLFALESYCKAQNALKAGRFQDELIDIEYTNDGVSHKLVYDELLMLEKEEDKVFSAPPIFLSNGTLTQYNTSLMCDCAAAMVIMDYDRAVQMDLRPLVEIYAVESAGVENDMLGLGMVEAVTNILRKSGLNKQSIGLFELNESFAIQAILCQRMLDIDPDKVNVNGGNLALGYPIGCTGIRMNITLIYEMLRRNVQFGLSAICAGSNMGQAIVFKNNLN